MDLHRSGPILCFGEVLLRLSAFPGTRMSTARNLDLYAGGAEANVGATLAALGRTVEMVTALPLNALGDLCAAELRRSGLGTANVLRFEGRLGTYFLEHGAGPRPASIVYDRAGSCFSQRAGEFDWSTLAPDASWFHLSGINLPISVEASNASIAVVDAMRGNGVPISFDVNHRASMWASRLSEAAELERRIMEATDVLFASPRDIGRALGRDFPDATPEGRRVAAEAAFDAFPNTQFIISTRRELSEGPPTLIVRIENRDAAFETEPTPVGPVIDRIGTGDAMAGAIIDAILREVSIHDIARAGIAAAVLKHGISGDQWVGTAAELEAFHAPRGADVLR
jgi:2-dehydro-3-deoxygluconokinase